MDHLIRFALFHCQWFLVHRTGDGYDQFFFQVDTPVGRLVGPSQVFRTQP